MSLSLPPNFKSDIQGRDTALVPFVIIGNLVDNVWDRFYFISTNQMNLGAAGKIVMARQWEIESPFQYF